MSNIVVTISKAGLLDKVIHTKDLDKLFEFLRDRNLSIVKTNKDCTTICIRDYSGGRKRTLHGNYMDMSECVNLVRQYSLNKG